MNCVIALSYTELGQINCRYFVKKTRTAYEIMFEKGAQLPSYYIVGAFGGIQCVNAGGKDMNKVPSKYMFLRFFGV